MLRSEIFLADASDAAVSELLASPSEVGAGIVQPLHRGAYESLRRAATVFLELYAAARSNADDDARSGAFSDADGLDCGVITAAPGLTEVANALFTLAERLGWQRVRFISPSCDNTIALSDSFLAPAELHHVRFPSSPGKARLRAHLQQATADTACCWTCWHAISLLTHFCLFLPFGLSSLTPYSLLLVLAIWIE